jgi:hypothetical protein
MHAQHQGCLLDLAMEMALASRKTLALANALLAVLVVLITAVR